MCVWVYRCGAVLVGCLEVGLGVAEEREAVGVTTAGGGGGTREALPRHRVQVTARVAEERKTGHVTVQ